MNWYFKHEGTGIIAGPFDREKVESLAREMDGIIFNDTIWDSGWSFDEDNEPDVEVELGI